MLVNNKDLSFARRKCAPIQRLSRDTLERCSLGCELCPSLETNPIGGGVTTREGLNHEAPANVRVELLK